MRLLKKWNDLDVRAKATIAFITCTFIARGIAFLAAPVFTRIMPQEEYGIIANYNSWAIVIEVFSTLGLTAAGVFNVGLNDYRDSRDEFLSSVVTITSVFTVVVFAPIIAFHSHLAEVLHLPLDLVVLMSVHFFFYPAQIFWVTRQRYEYRYKAAFAVTVTSALASQAFSVVAVFLAAGDQATVKLWATEAVNLLFYVPIYIMLLRKGRAFFQKKYWAPMLRLAFPLIPHYLSQHVFLATARIMITGIVSASAAAIYAVAYSINSIATLLWSSINGSLVPLTHERLNGSESLDLSSTVNPLLLLYSFACVTVSLLAPEAMRILAPPSYYEGVYLVPPLMAAAFVSSLYNLFANVEFYFKKTRVIALSTIATTALSLPLNGLLISQFGYISAGYATLGSYLLLAAFHYMGMRRCGAPRLYDLRYILLLTLATIGLCMLCCALYPIPALRYVAIAVLAAVGVAKRKTVSKILRRKGSAS